MGPHDMRAAAAAGEPEEECSEPEDSPWSHEGAQTSPARPPSQTAQLGWLLQLPGPLEADFWQSAVATRLLCTTDVLAFVMVLPNVVAAMLGRVNRSLPEGVQLPVGAKAILLLYWAFSILPVALMLFSLRHYKQHRTSVAIASRLYRLVGAALLTHPATVLGYVTQVAAVRQAALAGDIWKSLLTNTLLPTILHVQQSNCMLSFRLSLLFQLGLFGVAVVWAQGMPCYLPLPGTATAAAAAGGSGLGGEAFAAYLAQLPLSALVPPSGVWSSSSSNSSSSSSILNGTLHGVAAGAAAGLKAEALAAAALQHAGSSVCQTLQLLHELTLALFVAPLSATSIGGLKMCEGPAAFQLVYIFVAALLLLVVVPASSYFIELYAKQRWLKLQGVTGTPVAVPGSGVGAPGRNGQAKRQWDGRLAWPHVARLVLLVACCWAVSEAVTAALGGQCRPPLGTEAAAWMSTLW